MKWLILVFVLGSALILTPNQAAAQTAYASDGRPEFCIMADFASDRQSAEYIVGTALDTLGYSRFSGGGRQIMNNAQRLMGWMFYLYSQDLVHWRSDVGAGADILDTVDGFIRENGGQIPAMQSRYSASFNRAAVGCRSSIRF